MSGDRNDREEVGYGKPPKSGRFPKGKSGNPKGRPKGTRNFMKDVAATLDAPVPVTENGKRKTMSTQRAILMRLREKALTGNPHAMDKAIGLALQLGAEREAKAVERTLSASDEDILQRFLGTFRDEGDPETTDTAEEADDRKGGDDDA